jgi:adenylyltransferase/sulfurtransferase
MKQLSVAELSNWKAKNQDFQLIDVREEEENEAYNIGGDLIPLDEIIRNKEKINQDKPVVFYCKRGIRSQIAIQKLERKFGWNNLYNLTGGIVSMYN